MCVALAASKRMSTAAPTVRVATIADEPEIIRLLHLMHEESGFVSLDLDRARAMFARAFNREGGNIIGVIGDDKKIEAAICMTIGRFWYAQDWHLEEIFAFVDPEHRRSHHAKALLTFAKRCSTVLHIPLLIGVLSNKRTQAKVRLYRGQLGESVGSFFLFNSHRNPEDVTPKPRVRVRARTAPTKASEARAIGDGFGQL
jgi:hypothetical protein